MPHLEDEHDVPTVSLTPEEYDHLRGTCPRLMAGGLLLGTRLLDARARLVCPGCPPVPVAALAVWAERYTALAGEANPAQLPALLFDANGDPWPLTHYFPQTAALSDAARATFFAQVAAVGLHPNLDLRLIGERRQDVTAHLPASARWLVAGQLVELLGQRPDILAAFLSRPRHMRVYTTGAAFAHDGGVAGGDYDAQREQVQLGLARLFEGFHGALPGVAPLLHELGHMLDAFEPATGGMGWGRGLLPGLAPGDGTLYDAEARRLFVAGKALEARRYTAIQSGAARPQAAGELPIGHPYVFQNDGEFIAGYLELFFRTPHRFAALNPDLYAAFSTLLCQDPRRARPADFAFYVRENAAVYLTGAPITPAGISIPAA